MEARGSHAARAGAERPAAWDAQHRPEEPLPSPLGRLGRKHLDAHRFVPTHWLRNGPNFVPFPFFLY